MKDIPLREWLSRVCHGCYGSGVLLRVDNVLDTCFVCEGHKLFEDKS